MGERVGEGILGNRSGAGNGIYLRDWRATSLLKRRQNAIEKGGCEDSEFSEKSEGSEHLRKEGSVFWEGARIAQKSRRTQRGERVGERKK